MNKTLKVEENIDFSKAVKNPFAKIARAAKECNGELSPEESKKMMKEAIDQLRQTSFSGK